MWRLPGQLGRTCEGTTRREWLRAGGLSTFGLTLPAFLAAKERRPSNSASNPESSATPEAASRALNRPTFGRAKRCIVLFMFGAPAHQDLWDLKPHAPSAVRGEFNPIPSAVPDVFVGEHLPLLAQRTGKFAQIRSVTHPDNTHTVAMHYMLSGQRHQRPATNPQNAPDDFPCFGAVANYLSRQGTWKPGANARHVSMPASVSLNAPANQVSANNHIFPGFFAGFLGGSNDPLFVPQNCNAANFRPLPTSDAEERLKARQGLLSLVEQELARLEQTSAVRGLQGEYARAFDLLATPAVRRAFALEDERPETRQAYGHTPFGQGCLLARRLIEQGVPLVTVNWERDDAYWDTHAKNFIDLKGKLCPNMDRGFSTLLDDLEQRGLMDETLIVWLGEFGRTPAINNAAGRDHWAACNTVLLAGAGVPGGAVYGSSDRIAAYPASNPVTPDDLAATIYHILGIDREQHLYDSQQRPWQLTRGEPIWDLLGV